MKLTKKFLEDYIRSEIELSQSEEWDGTGDKDAWECFNKGYDCALSDLLINIKNWEVK